ncbi:hypothetical protein Glove_19g377 [Diversispora epigaea]|uniref:Uncharacterized protein n=1 Tax=Diversispora epigaea TaxID=1348612 RepID=A0A397JWW3_9GLOM|nr:hypothetical protein Glove_19g377 [Diversispora epigaea]
MLTSVNDVFHDPISISEYIPLPSPVAILTYVIFSGQIAVRPVVALKPGTERFEVHLVVRRENICQWEFFTIPGIFYNTNVRRAEFF